MTAARVSAYAPVVLLFGQTSSPGRNSVKKFVGAAAVLLVAIFGLALPAAAQYSLTVVVTPSTAQPGSVVALSVSGAQPGETVTITVTSAAGGAGGTVTLTANASGSATTNLTVPTTPGTYTVTVSAPASGRSGSTTLTVAQATTTTTLPAAPPAPAAPAAPSGGLPATGSDSTPTMWIAGIAIVVGAGLVGVAWKRVATRSAPEPSLTISSTRWTVSSRAPSDVLNERSDEFP